MQIDVALHVVSLVCLGVLLFMVRAIGKNINGLHRTGVLIEDIKSAKAKQLRPASPRQRLKYIERVINSKSGERE